MTQIPAASTASVVRPGSPTDAASVSRSDAASGSHSGSGSGAGSGLPWPAPVGPLSTQVTGSGPGLLLAHGASGSIEGNFVPLIPALAAGHTVVAPDYPGSGATPRATGPLMLDGLATRWSRRRSRPAWRPSL
ncbi:pimeloyl-ACP methyl ester carboxylesterase [Streptomyces zagrosensis]|uniref:Pimeloyl-ACP methyl ester carboxylesterase n=1 Tax=Streptomyces zagrosensis TaxID=1042984 RepID=A0A7W9UXX8_9ACTN|nr:hypothetical protein [Streptomyces zagrosensis]MBB5934801.1 pimeloyl-ACP methyl ester carboxylesterase [Streptomyces zagrosensis]